MQWCSGAVVQDAVSASVRCSSAAVQSCSKEAVQCSPYSKEAVQCSQYSKEGVQYSSVSMSRAVVQYQGSVQCSKGAVQ